MFVSYSHRDEKWLELLHSHLAMLRREGLVDVWYDRRIEAGQKIDELITESLEQSDIFVALVTVDFLNSNYCYEREMQLALQRASEGTVRIVPVIIEPCDWKSSPLAQFKAVPKDGSPVSLWANPHVAMLDVVTELRAILAHTPPTSTPTTQPARLKRVKVKRDFDVIERAEFRDGAFGVLHDFFQASVGEINQIGEPLKATFEEMSPTAFTCTIVNRAQRRGEAHITVHNQKAGGLGDLTYHFAPHSPPGTANGTISVKADEFQLYLKWDEFGFNSERDRKLTPEQVARLMWTDFVKQAGIEYE